MALEEITRQLGTSTTRRTVVKTGAKIAYAAPIVAASFKLTAMGASAVSGERCQKDAACAGASVCSNGTCACFLSDGNTGFCFAREFSCGEFPVTCTTSATCPPGYACAQTCCGQTCVPVCGNTTFEAEAAAADGGSSSL